MTSAIIVAAGKSTRMGPNADKLFIEVNGRPIVAHTWQRFDDTECIHEIIMVIRNGMHSGFAELAAKYSFKKPFRLVTGGQERQESAWSGLEALSPASEIV